MHCCLVPCEKHCENMKMVKMAHDWWRLQLVIWLKVTVNARFHHMLVWPSCNSPLPGQLQNNVAPTNVWSFYMYHGQISNTDVTSLYIYRQAFTKKCYVYKKQFFSVLTHNRCRVQAHVLIHMHVCVWKREKDRHRVTDLQDMVAVQWRTGHSTHHSVKLKQRRQNGEVFELKQAAKNQHVKKPTKPT